MLKNTYQFFCGLQGKWAGVIHHVVDQHEWVLGQGLGPGRCDHGPIIEEERTKPWLQSGSKPHTELRKVVFDARLQKNLTYYVNFRYEFFCIDIILICMYIFQKIQL